MLQLRELRKLHNLNQGDLAKIVGVSRSTIAMWETEKSQPDNGSIIRIAEYFGVTTDYLLGNNAKASKNYLKVPVFGKVAAGIPIEAIEDIEDYEELDAGEFGNGKFFALKIHGHSMEPRMTEGDVVIVRQQPDIDNGETAIVLVNGDEATCKKIKKTPEGVWLISTNPAYDPMFYSNKDIEELPVRILGKVVELRAKF